MLHVAPIALEVAQRMRSGAVDSGALRRIPLLALVALFASCSSVEDKHADIALADQMTRCPMKRTPRRNSRFGTKS